MIYFGGQHCSPSLNLFRSVTKWWPGKIRISIYIWEKYWACCLLIADVVTSALLCRVCTTSARLTIQPVGRNYWCTPSAGSANVLVFAKYKLNFIQVLDNSLFFCFCLFVHDQKRLTVYQTKWQNHDYQRKKVFLFKGSYIWRIMVLLK